LREALGYDETQLIMTFQSRFGPKKWLQPYTDKTLIELAQRGIKHVAVITPAFASDCVETLEEIAIAAGESFYEHNGESLTLIPCLNDSEESIDVLESLTRKVVSGW
jgi:ferrochelatase